MKVLLKDAKGGKGFIAACLEAVDDAALAFVGEPDAKIMAHLEATLMRELPPRLAAQGFDADTAALIARAMVKAIIGQKHELESNGLGIA